MFLFNTVNGERNVFGIILVMRPETKSLFWILLLLAVGFIGIVYFALQLPKEGRVTAPDFTVTALDGKTISLGDFRGRPLFLNFWSSW